jgi:hypothetical protein
LKVASRFGLIELRRQVCYHKPSRKHTLPGNQLLPAHKGMVITRGLQEWACLLPQELAFAPVARLLGWQTGESQVLCASTVRNLVRHHGQLLQQATDTQVSQLLSQGSFSQLKPVLVAPQPVRYRRGWPDILTKAVEAALAEPDPRAPEGISQEDWQRLLLVRQKEKACSVQQLRYLGPQLQPDEGLLSIDEVLTRKARPHGFLELRTARISTPAGYRYLCGRGESFVQLVLLFSRLCCPCWVKQWLVLADGARWIRNFFELLQAQLPAAELILDWYHLKHRCSHTASMIASAKKAKAELLGPLYFHLWRGQVQAALLILQKFRPQAKAPQRLEELITYLQAHQPFIPDYQQRRRHRRYIGSGQVEKTNDLLVTRRQKHQGMRWSRPTSHALAGLKTLLLNDGWNLYWLDHQLLPLALPAP